MQRDLCTLGQNPAIHEPAQKAAESFICSLYTSTKNFSNVDDARYFLFCQRNLKSEDLPPTSECLSHHIKRANFQAFVWNRALVTLQNIPSPDEHGWKLKNGKLFPVLMTRSPAPEGMTELTTCRCTTSECKRSCSCRKSNLPGREACLCMADEGCCNPLNEELLSDNDSSASDTE